MEEVPIGGSIENRGRPEVEATTPKLDSAQDLLAFAFAGDGNLGRMADPAPSNVPAGILPETGFVGENQGAVLRSGFFLRRG